MAEMAYALISYFGFLFLADTTPAPNWVKVTGAVIAALMFHLATRRPA